jgi:hypothetical protein
MNCIHLAQDRVQWKGLLNMVMNLRVLLIFSCTSDYHFYVHICDATELQRGNGTAYRCEVLICLVTIQVLTLMRPIIYITVSTNILTHVIIRGYIGKLHTVVCHTDMHS